MSATLIYFLAPMATGKTVASKAMTAWLIGEGCSVLLLDDESMRRARHRIDVRAKIEDARSKVDFIIFASSEPGVGALLPRPDYIYQAVPRAGKGRKKKDGK